MRINPEMIIKGRTISTRNYPYVIAEISANHNGKIENALELIKIAKFAGADAVKLQTYRPDTITINSRAEQFCIHEGLWKGKTLYQLYEEAHMPWEWHVELFQYAHKIGITLFSTPFDNTAVDLLESLNTPAYKIASFEAIDIPLIKYVASTGKPMIISTGLANAIEIEEAVTAAKEGGCKELAILHCVSGYPAPAEDYNLRTISDMKDRFSLVTGLSDHTINNVTAITSIALGASIIEKHITLDRAGGGPDDSFSLEPQELNALCRDVRSAWESLGNVNYDCKNSELPNIKFRRSLYIVKAMKAGEKFTEENIKSIRPGYGMKPKYYFDVLNKVAAVDIEEGSALSEDVIAGED
jgi:pseudaminic acid synthase